MRSERSREGLSGALRAGTAEAHEAAEHVPFAEALAGGAIGVGGWADLLVDLAPVYAALEGGSAALAADPLAGPFVDAALHRSTAIQADLEALGASGTPSPEALAYAARIAEVVAEPHRWVAHHYTRYLGDLSGGRTIARALRSSLGLDAGAGASFLAFDAIASPAGYKQAYRDRLDRLGDALDERRRAEVVDEAKLAFAANQRLLADLSERHGLVAGGVA